MFINIEGKVEQSVKLLLSDTKVNQFSVNSILGDIPYLKDDEVLAFCRLVADELIAVLKKCQHDTGCRLESFIINLLINQRYKPQYIAKSQHGLIAIPFKVISFLAGREVEVIKAQEFLQETQYKRILNLSIEPSFKGQLAQKLESSNPQGCSSFRAGIFMFIGFRIHFKDALDEIAIRIMTPQN